MKLKFKDILKIENVVGNIAVIDNEVAPFEIKGVYYLYDIPSSFRSCEHSQKKKQQVLITISGSFGVEQNNGKNKKTITLNKPDKSLLLRNNTWSQLENFSSGAVCMVLASEVFSKAEYIGDFNFFLQSVQ
ncbi:MAG: sugar 3,4-ketoisomerase [Flavobacterium sp.]